MFTRSKDWRFKTVIIPSKDTTFSQFVGSMIIDFPMENIQSETNENNWKLWGSNLVQLSTFSKNGAPDTSGFENRTDWEQAVFKSMASFS